jgi:hypothetical protein
MAMVLDVVAFEEDGLILTEWRSEGECSLLWVNREDG